MSDRIHDRREFLELVAAGVGAAGLGAILPGCERGPQPQTGAREVVIGYVSPQTGPLAPFGATDSFIVPRVAAAINKMGLVVDGQPASVRVKVGDSQSNPTRAGEVAKGFITNDKADLILAAHTPDTTNPVAAVCETARVPCISTVAPIAPWLAGGPYRYTFHFFWDLPDIIKVFTGMWESIKTNKVVGGLWPNDPDGIVWAKEFTATLTASGYKVVDLGRYPNGTQDYTTFIQGFKKAQVEILTGVPIPPDFAAAWRQCRQQGFVPKVASIGKAILFPSAVEALGGGLGVNLTSEVWWSPGHPYKSSLTGETASELASAYTAQWTQPLGYVYALFEVAANVLARAGSTQKDKLVAAIQETKLDTLVGPVQFGQDHVGRTPLVGGQWVKGTKYPYDLRVVYNDTAPSIAKAAPLAPITL